jgi:hypothetical protein
MDQWYEVSKVCLDWDYIGFYLLREFWLIVVALNAVYNYNLQVNYRNSFLQKTKSKLISKAQLALFHKLKKIFPDIPVEQNYKFPGFQADGGRKHDEFDVSYPMNMYCLL